MILSIPSAQYRAHSDRNSTHSSGTVGRLLEEAVRNTPSPYDTNILNMVSLSQGQGYSFKMEQFKEDPALAFVRLENMD